jgi:hypothetical protein
MLHCNAHKWVCVKKYRRTVCLKYDEKTSPWEWVALCVNFLRLQRVKRASISGNRSGNTFAKTYAVELRKIFIFIHTRETLSLRNEASRGVVAQRNFVLIVSFKCWLLIRLGSLMFVATLMLRKHQNFKMPDSRPCHQRKPDAIFFSHRNERKETHKWFRGSVQIHHILQVCVRRRIYCVKLFRLRQSLFRTVLVNAHKPQHFNVGNYCILSRE